MAARMEKTRHLDLMAATTAEAARRRANALGHDTGGGFSDAGSA
jgi:hypothetical protein